MMLVFRFISLSVSSPAEFVTVNRPAFFWSGTGKQEESESVSPQTSRGFPASSSCVSSLIKPHNSTVCGCVTFPAGSVFQEQHHYVILLRKERVCVWASPDESFLALITLDANENTPDGSGYL